MSISIQLPTDVPLGHEAGVAACRAMQRGQRLLLADHDRYIAAELDAPMAVSAHGVAGWVHGARSDKAELRWMITG